MFPNSFILRNLEYASVVTTKPFGTLNPTLAKKARFEALPPVAGKVAASISLRLTRSLDSVIIETSSNVWQPIHSP
jgi:hypothetical protein